MNNTGQLLKLRPYQNDGVDFLVDNKRAILADDMRLGKTAQALMAARELSAGAILIVAPKTAAGVWIDEASTWLAEGAISYNGTARDRSLFDEPAKLVTSIVVTNYKLAAEVAELQASWDVIIFDEAHKLRNSRKRKAKIVNGERVERGPWRAIHNLVATQGLFFLTGTPVTKNAGDLYPLLHMIDAKRFSSYWAFVKRWAYVYQDQFGWTVEGSRDEAKLRHELRHIMLRRTTAQVRPELPATQRQLVPIELTAKQGTAYRRMAKELEMELDDGTLLLAPGTLAKFTRLRQLLVTPRILGIADDGAAIEALVDELGGAEAPALIFTPFAEAIPHIAAALHRAHIKTYEVHGGQTAKRLAEQVAGFQGDRNPARALIATTQQGTAWAGNAATVTYFLGYMWNPADNAQAEARMGGQERPTFAKYYRYNGTIDDHMLDILNGKARTAARILRPTVASEAEVA